jgi:hypothetical protein
MQIKPILGTENRKYVIDDILNRYGHQVLRLPRTIGSIMQLN